MSRNFAIYLTILSVCLLTGVAVLLTGHKIPFIKATNAWVFKNIAQNELKDQDLLLDSYDGLAAKRHLLREVKTDPVPPPMIEVDFDLTSDDLNMSIPPHASDMAFFFDELRSGNVTNLHLTTRFHRSLHVGESEGELDSLILLILSEKNDPPLENLIIPLELTRAAQDTSFPAYLNDTSMDLDLITGDTSLLPIVNKVVHSPYDGVNFKTNGKIPPCVKFGFASIESEQTPGGKAHLLARWGDKVLIHQSLLSSMTLHNVTMEDLSIKLGEYISLGKNKPIIPIDTFGCIKLENSAPDIKVPHSITVDQLARKIEKEQSLMDAPPHALITSTPTSQTSIQLIDRPYPLISQLYQVPTFEIAATYLRLPTWLEACVLVEFTLICAALYALKGANRHLCYALFLVLLWPLASILQAHAGYWFPLAPPLCLILIGWSLSIYMSTKWSLRRPTSRLSGEEKKELARFD